MIRKPSKDEERTIVSKKNSINQLCKKSSKVDLSDIHALYHKLNDNYLPETQAENRFEQEDNRQNKSGKETPFGSDLLKKTLKGSKLM